MNHYYKAFITLNELVIDRGYEPLQYASHLVSLDTFIDWNASLVEPDLASYMQEHELSRELALVTDPMLALLRTAWTTSVVRFLDEKNKKKLYIIWTDSVNNKVISDIYTEYTKKNAKRIIVVFDGSITSPAKNIIEKSKYIQFTFLSTKDLQYNITHHVLQPKYKLLNFQERLKFFNEYYPGPKTNHIKMLVTDPIAIYFGARPGDVFMTTRRSDNGQIHISYRYIIEESDG